MMKMWNCATIRVTITVSRDLRATTTTKVSARYKHITSSSILEIVAGATLYSKTQITEAWSFDDNRINSLQHRVTRIVIVCFVRTMIARGNIWRIINETRILIGTAWYLTTHLTRVIVALFTDRCEIAAVSPTADHLQLRRLTLRCQRNTRQRASPSLTP